MKICFFNCSKVWGGGEKWHLDHVLALQEAGHEVIVVSNKDSELIKRAQKQNIRTHCFRVGNLSFLNLIKLIQLKHFFSKEKFNVIIFNFSIDLKFAAPIAKLCKIPRIIYRRGSAIPIKNSFINRWLYKNCLTDILANSEATKKTILQNNPLLFPEEKIKIIYNGIDTSFHKTKENKNAIPVIGALGRLVYQKGFDILLDIVKILKERNVVCKIKIGGDGILKEELLNKAQLLNILDYVEFVGFVENSVDFMRNIDVFVLTSRWEGFGYVLAEAMLQENPVVAFNISSNPELVIDNQNGILVPFGEIHLFADAIQKILENNELRESFGKNGYMLACEKFDFKINKQKVVNYIIHE